MGEHSWKPLPLLITGKQDLLKIESLGGGGGGVPNFLLEGGGG